MKVFLLEDDARRIDGAKNMMAELPGSRYIPFSRDLLYCIEQIREKVG